MASGCTCTPHPAAKQSKFDGTVYIETKPTEGHMELGTDYRPVFFTSISFYSIVVVSTCERQADLPGHYGSHTRPQVADRGTPSRSGTRG